jgi:colanic acid biosynthesis glycosyl transferase WcaI
VLSPGFKHLLIERGVPAEKIHIVYNWADDIFQPLPKDEALAQELGLVGRFNVIYAGNLGEFQGLETVIKAALLLKDTPDIQIVMVGTGQKEAEIRALAQQRGADNVRFLSHREYREMPRINSLADVLLVHLRDLPFFTTTIPGKTQVSLASGRPVLMAVRGDAADLIRRSGAGLTCEPENEHQLAQAIQQLHSMSPEQREALGQQGRKFYQQEISLDVAGARMETILSEVAQRRNRTIQSHSLPLHK